MKKLYELTHILLNILFIFYRQIYFDILTDSDFDGYRR